jgi:hypothetical protein
MFLTMGILFGTASFVRADVPVTPNAHELVIGNPLAIVIAGIAAMVAIVGLGLWVVKKQSRGNSQDQ